jgi:guanylate kinase
MSPMNKRGLLVVVSGPSGCGKGTVLSRLLKDDPNIFYSISATTRAPRPGEVDGVHYYFLTKEQFEEKIRNNGMLEYACYVGNYYGTPSQAVEAQRAAGHDVILEIEVQGAMQVKEKCPDAVFIFIMPPNMEELRRRLIDRQTESEEVVNSRMKTAEEEMKAVSHYDYVVINDEVESAVERIKAILEAEKCRTVRMNNN